MQISQQITFSASQLALAIGLALSVFSQPCCARAETPAAGAPRSDRQAEFAISAQPLNSALLRFAEQAGLQVFFADVKLDGMQSSPLRGRYPIEQGLRQLIGGNPVNYQISPTGQITLSKPVISGGGAHDVITVRALSVAHEGDWIYDQPRAISVISREQMDNRPARHAADMLEQSAGVYSSVSQQDPALSVNIRGIQDYGRVNMNIDGMRQNFQKSGHGQRNGQMYIDSELLSDVTIEKGATSGMGGAGAFGGIATFNTVSASDFLAPGKEIGGKLHASTGDNGTQFIGSGILALGSETGDILIGASERHFGDYWPGNTGEIGDIRTSTSDVYNTGTTTDSLQDALKHTKVLDSNYSMRSRLAKIGWNLPANQRIQLSYLQTQTSTPNASMITAIYDDPANTKGPYTLGWKSSGFSEVMSRSAALDYSLQPDDQNWLDFNAKLYYVNTNDDTAIYSTSTSTDNGYSAQTQMKTYGLQAENTSYFNLPAIHNLQANYGLDIFYDKANSESTKETMVGVTPSGNRMMTSLFTNLTYSYDDWLRLESGIRYDRYRLRGNTSMNVWNIKNPCTERRKASCTYQDIMSWDVDRGEGKFSPTLGLGIKPGVQWLEFFANYGKSWRPPAITETLTSGSAHSSATQYPNPYLEAERSRSWEVGFNIQKPDLFLTDDRLVAKVNYFDTRVNNYASLATNRMLPGYGELVSSGSAAYVNNLAKTRFRGLEYQLNYDAGTFYVDFTYTRIIGFNDFCAKVAYLGNKIEFGGEAYNWYPVEYEDNSVACRYSTLKSAPFSNLNYLPSDRGTLTLGGRAFDRQLDFGMVIRYNRGYQDHSAVSSSGAVSDFYVADWPKYTLFDLYANYKVTDALTLRGSIENVANRAYIVSYGDSLSYTLGRGRTIQAGLEYRF
ncbi:TonB-dependent hemoglobin/transferrin/lactoferrin family receptor [Affinibrenneria salicis]|uniref:TonB-dependent hemoglobin/transferrin/lactoferrin family receptor n=1 Tax=Affinibrenneria salicis TaxID=2590031 RepID=A0A5J5G158_9GAMM|nr:TonB-dependent receptor [Affinibrenneria salicis]KAA9000486.1 TonB-dependent hemoglobin/transferrin/lactoferrin family receptor [Affinibrenneria salicis]